MPKGKLLNGLVTQQKVLRAAVALFLKKKIRFLDIGEVVNEALDSVPFIPEPTLDDILSTRDAAGEYVAAKFGD